MANYVNFYDPTDGLNGKDIAIENIHEHDLVDGDRITHRELMFMGTKTSGTYNIQVNGKYLNIRREVDGVTTILNSNLDTHGAYSQLSLMAVKGAKYYIEGALKEIRCNSNQLTTLDVSKCTALTYLDCYSNQLTTLDVSKCTALTYLDCNSNQLTTLDVSKCTALTYLGCYSNQLTTLDVSKCTALSELHIENNGEGFTITWMPNPTDMNVQLLYEEGYEQSVVERFINELPSNADNCNAYIFGYTDIWDELADAIADAEDKGWNVIDGEY